MWLSRLSSWNGSLNHIPRVKFAAFHLLFGRGNQASSMVSGYYGFVCHLEVISISNMDRDALASISIGTASASGNHRASQR